MFTGSEPFNHLGAYRHPVIKIPPLPFFNLLSQDKVSEAGYPSLRKIREKVMRVK